MLKRNSIFDKALLLLIAILLGALSFYRLNTALLRRLDEVSESSGNDFLYLVLFALFLVYALFHIKNLNGSLPFWLFATYFILSYLVTVPFSFIGLANLLIVTLWLFCYWFGRRLAETNRELIPYFIRVILLIVVLPLSTYCFYTYYTTDLVIDQHASDFIFFITAYFPFVLLIEKNSPWKILIIALFSLLAIISFKRSIIVGFVLCLIVFFLNTDYKKYLSKWYTWLLLLATFVFGFYIFNAFSETLIGRFANIESDQGSGRTIIYSQVMEEFSQSGFFHMTLGHGFESVKTITITNELAHNDLLELLYDFGILGLIIYILFLLSLFKSAFRCRKDVKTKSLYASFLGSLLLFIIVSSLNCVIYSSMIISPFMLAFGIYNGLLNNSQQRVVS